MRFSRHLRDLARKQRRAMRPLVEEAMRADSGALKIAIDCSIDEYRPRQMNDKEVIHLAKQVSFAHTLNHQFPRPCHLHLTGLTVGGRLDSTFREHIDKYGSLLVTKTDNTPDVCFHGNNAIYLSPDSPVECECVEVGVAYVVGGLVDRTVDKGVTESYAQRLGLRTARLPIHRHIRVEGGYHVCLPINLVVGVLLSVHADGDWTKAFLQFIPQRKR